MQAGICGPAAQASLGPTNRHWPIRTDPAVGISTATWEAQITPWDVSIPDIHVGETSTSSLTASALREVRTLLKSNVVLATTAGGQTMALKPSAFWL